MASCVSTYDERLGLADCFEEYKEYLSQQHYNFLAYEALEETRGGAGKLKYILALARRCKTGALSVDILAKQIDKEYHLTPLPQEEQEGGKEEEAAEGHRDMDTEMEETDLRDEEKQDKEAEEEEEHEEAGQQSLHVSEQAKELVNRFENGFFQQQRWARTSPAFVLPGDGYWLDNNRIQEFRTSTYEDFARATPKPMPVYISRNPFSLVQPLSRFRSQERSYHLCRKVAVSFDGDIFRATDGEIQVALAKHKCAPSTDAGTYVEAVQEVLHRHAASIAHKSTNSGNPSGPKRRRVDATT